MLRSASSCLPDLLGRPRIRFESGKADIVARILTGLLDRHDRTALRCRIPISRLPDIPIPTATNRSNQALSEKRAQAVTDYLVRRDCRRTGSARSAMARRSRLPETITNQGRAQNRRIDFVVK